MTVGIYIMAFASVISVIGAIGLLRFPDVYTRAHAQTVVNVGGSALFIIGAVLELLENAYAWKLVALLVLLFVGSPTATHAITKSAYETEKGK